MSITMGIDIGSTACKAVIMKEGKDIPIEIEIKAQQMLDDVWSVEAYPADAMVYLYVFLADDITYTFIAPDRNSGFFMYALEQ